MLRLVARGSLAYVFPTTPESAMLVLSPQDSTVLLTGRTTIRAGEPARGASGRFWITRELRRRPDGWCQRRGRVGG